MPRTQKPSPDFRQVVRETVNQFDGLELREPNKQPTSFAVANGVHAPFGLLEQRPGTVRALKLDSSWFLNNARIKYISLPNTVRKENSSQFSKYGGVIVFGGRCIDYGSFSGNTRATQFDLLDEYGRQDFSITQETGYVYENFKSVTKTGGLLNFATNSAKTGSSGTHLYDVYPDETPPRAVAGNSAPNGEGIHFNFDSLFLASDNFFFVFENFVKDINGVTTYSPPTGFTIKACWRIVEIDNVTGAFVLLMQDANGYQKIYKLGKIADLPRFTYNIDEASRKRGAACIFGTWLVWISRSSGANRICRLPTDFDPENFEVTSFLIPTLLNTRGAALGVHRKCLCLLGTTAANTTDTFCLGWREWPTIWDDENALIMQEGLTSGYVAAGFADFSDDFIVTGIYNTTEDAVSHAIIAIEKACTLNISETGKISLISSSELDENAGAVKTVQGDELNGLLLGQLSPVQDLPNTLNVLDKVLVAWPSRPISLSDGNISVVKIEDFVDYNFLTTLNAPPTAKMLCLVGSGVILAGRLSGYDPIIDSELLSRCIRWTLPYSPGSPLDGPPFASYQVWPQTYFQILDAEPRAVWSNGPFAYVATDRLLYKFQIIEGQFGRGAADIIHRASGCAGPRAWCHTDKGTFFLSQNGVFVCNGETVEKVSEPIGPLFSSGALNTTNLDRAIGIFNQKTRQVIFFLPWQTASRYCNAAIVFELDGNHWWTWFPANQERGLFFADAKTSPDGNMYGIAADGTLNLIALHAENDGGHEIPVEFSLRPFYSMEAGLIARLEFVRITYAKTRGEPEAYESPDADKIKVKLATKYRAVYPAIKDRTLPTAVSENPDEQGQFFEKRLNLGEKGYSFTLTFTLNSQQGGLKLKSIGHEGWNYGGSDR